MYLLVICKSLGKCLVFLFLSFCFWAVCIFLIYILGINPYVTCDLKISSLICTLCFHFLLFLLLDRGFSVWCSPTCWLCFGGLCSWWSYEENHCQDGCQVAFPFWFLLGVYSFRSYVSVRNPHWVNLCAWYKVGSSFLRLHRVMLSVLSSSTIHNWSDRLLALVTCRGVDTWAFTVGYCAVTLHLRMN